MPTDAAAPHARLEGEPTTGALRERLQRAVAASLTIERELGGGGMSAVFAAYEPALERRVAVKVLSPALTGAVDGERFRQEVLLLARLQHPHIVPILRTGEADALPFFVMPFVEGESLRARLERTGALPLGEGVRVLRSVAAALSYAHARGVVHRDVKPDNVLLAAGGIATVTDFGVARALDAATRSTAPAAPVTEAGLVVGTPAYMAPEQATADPDADHRVDIYAFGMLAYEVFTGDIPFASRSGVALLAAQLVERPTPVTSHRADLPPRIAALVMRCLEKRPEDRPQSADYLTAVLDALLVPGGEVARHVREEAQAVATPPPRRRRALQLAALLLAAASAGATAQRAMAGDEPVERQRVLLTTFGGAGADSILSGVLAEAVRSDVSRSRRLALVPASAVEQAQHADRLPGTTLDAGRARALSARLREPVAAVVDGGVTEVGGVYAIRLELLAPDTGDVLAAVREAAGDLAGVMPAMDRLSVQARRELERRSMRGAG